MVVSSVLSVPPTHTFISLCIVREQTLQGFAEMCGTPALTKLTELTTTSRMV
mgnify:FL=1|jgi:hypothetical protein